MPVLQKGYGGIQAGIEAVKGLIRSLNRLNAWRLTRSKTYQSVHKKPFSS